MTSDSDTDMWHCNATWHWQCHVSHRDLTRDIFIYFFKKKLIFFKKNQKNHRLTRGTLTNGVSQLCLKGS